MQHVSIVKLRKIMYMYMKDVNFNLFSFYMVVFVAQFLDCRSIFYVAVTYKGLLGHESCMHFRHSQCKILTMHCSLHFAHRSARKYLSCIVVVITIVITRSVARVSF